MDLNLFRQSVASVTSIKALDRQPPAWLKEKLVNAKLMSDSLTNAVHLIPEQLHAFIKRHRQVSAIYPSAGLALTMHHHTVITCQKFKQYIPIWGNIADNITQHEALVGGAFFDDFPVKPSLDNSLNFHKIDGGTLVLEGFKKPCSLSSIADYFLLSAMDKQQQSHLLLINNNINIAKNNDYWRANVFFSSDTQCIHFSHVATPTQALLYFDSEIQRQFKQFALIMFTLLVTNTYLGIFDRICDIIETSIRTDNDFNRNLNRITLTMNTFLDLMIEKTNTDEENQNHLDTVLVLRYQIEALLMEGLNLIGERLDLVSLIGDPNLQHLFNCIELFKYHTISAFSYFSHKKISPPIII